MLLGVFAVFQENVSWLKVHWYNQKYLYPKFTGYRDNDERSFKEWELLYIIDFQIHIKKGGNYSFCSVNACT